MTFVEWNGWIAQSGEETDRLWSQPIAHFYDLLDKPRVSLTVPLLFHWLFFFPKCRQGELGEDGHPPRGAELPPIEAPRRMWAGSELEFHSPASFGDEILKRSQVVSVREKLGKSGPLVFVGVRHDISAAGRLCVTEHQTIVYRDNPTEKQKANPKLPAACKSQRVADVAKLLSVDSRMLFRYSALTYNAHRIHYDLEYARNIEAYPGLVVHGPLQAMLLLDFVMGFFPERSVQKFQFSGVRPLIAPQTLCMNLSHQNGAVTAWIVDKDGSETMIADLVFQP